MGLNIQIYFLAAYFNYSFSKMRTRSGAAFGIIGFAVENLLLTRRILERLFSLHKVSRCRRGFRERGERVAQEAGFVADLFTVSEIYSETALDC